MFAAMPREPRRRYARFAWAHLVLTLLVIQWGTFVRATLAGDGCGDHWPLCNGEVIPVAPTVETLVEMTHRVSSGLAWILALVGLLWARRALPPSHPARTGAALTLLFYTTEALVGAGLVLFRMVADNPSTARGWWMMAHLLNTFLLLFCMTLTAWWASGGARLSWRLHPGRRWLLVAALGSVLVVAMGGAVAALGDTLFPAASLADGLRADMSASSHVFLRLRVLHPVAAIGSGLLILWAAGVTFGAARGDRVTRRVALAVAGLYVLQVGLGFLDVALLAPVWLQLLHLLGADCLWMALTLLLARALAVPELASAAPPSDHLEADRVVEDDAA